MTTDELIVMGKIGAVHGVRGEVKIHSFTDPTENLFDYPVWHLRRDGVTKQVKLASACSQGKGLVAKIEGLDDREIARTYTGFEICVPRSELPELEEGEYYWHQLVGLQVIDQQQQLLGKVSHLLRSEERRVGKECRSRWYAEHQKKNINRAWAMRMASTR